MTRAELVKSLEADLGKQLGSNYGYDWCAAYVSDKLLKPIGEKWFSSCTQMRDYFNAKGRVNHDYKTAEVGDIIHFDWDLSGDCDHVGIVVGNENGIITTIEGNTNGDHWKLSKVAKHTYNVNYKYFADIVDMSSVFAEEAPKTEPKPTESTSNDEVLKAVKLVIDGEVVYDGYFKCKR